MRTRILIALSLAVLAVTSFQGCSSDDGSSDSSTSDAASADAVDDANGDASGDAGETDTVLSDTEYWPALTCEASEERCAAFGDAQPERLSEHAAAYDYDREQMLLFGGSMSVPENCGFPASQFSGDTWLYDVPCGAWRLLEGNAPQARGRHMMAYGDGNYWLFGGRYRADGGSGAYSIFDALWRFDAEDEAWTAVDVSGEVEPSARVSGAMGWDVRRDQLWMIGGNTSLSAMAYEPRNDVWRFDPATAEWQRVFEHDGALCGTDYPCPRLFHTLLYDYKRDRFVLFGGADDSAFTGTVSYFKDVWALELDPPRWVRLNAGTGAAPEGRFWGRWIHDTVRDSYILFGGHDDQTLGNRNDAWEYLPVEDQWVELADGDYFNSPQIGFCDFPADFTIVDTALPERRNAHTMIWSPTCEHGVIFGGKTDCGAIDDVWEYADGAFSERIEALEGEVCHRFRSNPDNCANMCF